MEFKPFGFAEILPGLWVYRGAVNTGILAQDDRAILIDCDDTLTPERLAELGIRTVERIYCTQHRRPNTAGAAAWQADIWAPEAERRTFEDASAHWHDWRNRWHLYHCRPGPLALLEDIPLRGTLREGDTVRWGEFTIRVLETPGMTDGAVSYVVELPATTPAPRAAIFCGDVLYGAGQLWDVHSLQKSMGTSSDYHGFLGATRMLTASLAKLGATQADFMVPAHGDLIAAHAAATELTARRLRQLFRNYAAISALNHYFPHVFQDLADDPWRMAPAETIELPDFVRPVAFTSYAVRSQSGAHWLIDCGYDSVLETLAAWKEQGLCTDVEGCWVTHYHDDHVDALHHLGSLGVPIYTDEHMAEILAHPSRFYLPCISPTIAPVARATTDGETWRWREFELTALHFPGQTLYHGGLLVRGPGATVLFCGDSFAPTGLDDYTAGNRNWLGAGVGLRRCIDLLRRYRPDVIINQHQARGFRFSDGQLDYMERMLVARQALLAEMLPWADPNYGTDEGWVRAYPYEVEAAAGGSCELEVRATNHTAQPRALAAEPVLPPGWRGVVAPAYPDEIRGERMVRAPLSIGVPAGTAPGTYPLAFRVTWDGRYLGQVCHALVRVW